MTVGEIGIEDTYSTLEVVLWWLAVLLVLIALGALWLQIQVGEPG